MSRDDNEVQRMHEESLALRRRSGNLRGVTLSLAGLAHEAIARDDFVAAWRYMHEHRQINETLGDPSGVATSLCIMGRIAHAEGNYQAARQHYEHSVMLCQQCGDLLLLPEVLLGLGMAKVQCGERADALALYQQALAILQEQSKVTTMVKVLSAFSDWAVVCGRIEQATCLAGAVSAGLEGMNLDLQKWELVAPEQVQEVARQQLDSDRVEAMWAVGRAMTLVQAAAYAMALAAT
jgi:hypothetical protein